MISVARESKRETDRESAPESDATGPNAHMRSPCLGLPALSGGSERGKPVIDLGVGEPRHPIPDFVGPVIAAHINDFGRYPRNEGIPEFRAAVSAWAGRRSQLARAPDPNGEVLVLAGSREGLFLGAIAARRYVPPRAGRPAILVPNPFYAAYSAGAIAADCDVIYLPGTRATGFLPDLDAIDPAVLARTVVFYIASPSNPQGAVASLA